LTGWVTQDGALNNQLNFYEINHVDLADVSLFSKGSFIVASCDVYGEV
jgi:hypothetical protein